MTQVFFWFFFFTNSKHCFLPLSAPVPDTGAKAFPVQWKMQWINKEEGWVNLFEYQQPFLSLQKQQNAIKTGSFLETKCWRRKQSHLTVTGSVNKSHKSKKYQKTGQGHLELSVGCTSCCIITLVWVRGHLEQTWWHLNWLTSAMLKWKHWPFLMTGLLSPHLRKQTNADKGEWHHPACLFCPLLISNTSNFSRIS